MMYFYQGYEVLPQSPVDSCPSPKHHPLQFDLAFIVVPSFVDCTLDLEHC